ncbi:MAG: hypothetical protein CMF19_07230, partial [Idiomarinaceae bacterium]|nr:hypothetical protein [Idiomarinaceae bacterium]
MRQQSQQPKQGTAELEYLDPDDDAIKPVALEPTEGSEPLPSRPQKRRHLSRWLLLGMLLLLAAVTIESALLIVESFN